jgi:hypothetical protein
MEYIYCIYECKKWLYLMKHIFIEQYEDTCYIKKKKDGMRTYRQCCLVLRGNLDDSKKATSASSNIIPLRVEK